MFLLFVRFVFSEVSHFFSSQSIPVQYEIQKYKIHNSVVAKGSFSCTLLLIVCYNVIIIINVHELPKCICYIHVFYKTRKKNFCLEAISSSVISYHITNKRSLHYVSVIVIIHIAVYFVNVRVRNECFSNRSYRSNINSAPPKRL